MYEERDLQRAVIDSFRNGDFTDTRLRPDGAAPAYDPTSQGAHHNVNTFVAEMPANADPALQDTTKPFEENAMSTTTPPQRRPTIDDMIAVMQKGSMAEFPRLAIPGGDTLVYIDPPPQLPSQDNFIYKQICQRYNEPFWIRSQTLKGLASPFFQRLLGPTAQYRVQRHEIWSESCLQESDIFLTSHHPLRVRRHWS